MSTHGSDRSVSLQEAVLPRHLPVLSGLDVAATYLLPPDLAAGGDWVDVVATPAGEVVLVVGDVAGRGVDAVATMSQVRSLLREHVRLGEDVATAVRAVDHLAVDLEAAATATVCVVAINPSSGRLVYCTAGHPPPLVVGLDGRARYLPRTGARALRTGGEFTVAESRLRPGELLLLYTDGAVQRQAPTRVDGPQDLAACVAEAFATVGGGHGIRAMVDDVCHRVLRHVADAGPSFDDVVLLSAELMPPQRELRLDLPSGDEATTAARSAVHDWLHELRVRDLDAAAALQTLGELVANAAQHAYVGLPPGESGRISVRASLEEHGTVVLVVEDRGRWRPGGSHGSGRGLAMARSFADHLRLERRPEGTRATSRHYVGRAVQLMQSSWPPGRNRAPSTTTDDSGRVSVHGDVDTWFVESLRDALTLSSRGGTVPLVVDLSEATYLCSAAIQLLVEVLDWAHDEVTVSVVVVDGCAAHQVLETLGVPHRIW